MWPSSFLVKPLQNEGSEWNCLSQMQNAGQKQLRLLGDYSHLSSGTHADARWIILMMFLLYSCHLIAPTLCLAQKSLIWIALYLNHIHIYNVDQLQLNFKLHCGKLCQSTRVSAMKFLCCSVFFCFLQVGLDSFGSTERNVLKDSIPLCLLRVIWPLQKGTLTQATLFTLETSLSVCHVLVLQCHMPMIED